IFAFLAVSVPAATIYVDANGTGDYTTIQAAINAANDDDTVLVADGVYTGKGNRDIDFRGKAITVRSENGPNNCIIDCNGTEVYPHRGFYFYSGEDANSIVDGFTITNGYAMWGGGIYCNQSSPTVVNCTFSGNLVYSSSCGDPRVAYGGGMYNYGGSPTITNCTFSGNSAYGSYYVHGGGMFNHGGSPKITNCTFSGNSAYGIDHVYGSVCGGGILTRNGNPTLTNCIFIGNSADYGGAIYDYKSNKAMVTNCILYDDRALYGNEIVLNDSVVDVNYSNVEGGQADVYVESDCVLNWGPGNLDVDPCFVEAGYWDPNGTPDDTNDDFWVEGDYHLSPESLCINAGDPNFIAEPNETDLDGLPRVIGGRIDMGAYEFNHQPVADAGPNQIAYAFIDGYADVNLDGSGSYDDDNDVLDYYWFWTIDSNDYEANGVSPTISLPVGEHTIELVVDDDIDLSEPNHCTVTVIAPLQARFFCIPRTLNRKAWYPKSVLALISMPPGIRKA
ncbi:unnamed protein product, partial [marine sediment metagenome]